MKLTSGIYLFVCGVIAIGMSGCSGDLAGGTGVGNPTTEIALSMQTVDGNTLTSALSKQLVSTTGSPQNQKPHIDIHDNSGNEFQVTSAWITVAKVKFFSDTEETPWVDGPFTFDAITGESEPSLVSIDIPSGTYSGIRLLVTKIGNNSVDGTAIDVSGTFDYLGETRSFTISLTSNLSIDYTLETSTLELIPDAKMNLTITLHADEWLAGTSITNCLDSGGIILENDGSLIIDDSISTGSCRSIGKNIRHNILGSGKIALF